MIDRAKLQSRYEFLKPTSLTDGLMAFGFECGDGWLPILDETFAGFQKLVEKGKVPKDFKVLQVKEKYGELRVYCNYEPDDVTDLTVKAMKKSVKICEKCGKGGKLVEIRGWLSTLCPEHAEKKRKSN